MNDCLPHARRVARIAGAWGLAALLSTGHCCPLTPDASLLASGVADAPDITQAQVSAEPTAATGSTCATPGAREKPLAPGQVRLRTGALIAAGVGAVAAYGRAQWWQDGFSGRFKTVNEGWFGQNTRDGGADKLGHAFFTYSSTRLLRHAFEWAGNDADTALRLGLWTSVGTMMGVELLDGYSKRWRFSKEDAALNLAGAALGYWLEKNPTADALLDFRLQYRASMGPQGRRKFSPFGDYSGQTYLLVFKGSGVRALREHPVLRYLEFSLGYNARDFEQESRGFAPATRHAYAGISLNFSELLRHTAYQGNLQPSRTQRLTETFFEFVQVPGTAALADHRLK